MSKQIEEFKKSWVTVQANVTKGLEEIKKNANAISQTSGVMNEGVKEIGLRVQELKDLGNKGTAISAFMFDPEIKTMMSSVQGFCNQIDAECKRIDALHKGAFKSAKDAFWKLKKELVAEIATRKKAVSTKLGTGNKSLPDMEKLLVEMNKYTDSTFATFDSFVPEVGAQFKKELDFAIDDQVKQSKAAALTSFQKEMDEQALNTRVLQGNLTHAKKLLESVRAEVAEAETAFKAKNLAGLMTAKLNAVAPNKELVELAAKYERAKTDEWIMGKLKASKDKSTIEAGMKAIIDLKTLSKAAIAKVANLKL